MNICFLSKSQLKSIGGIETYTDLISDALIKAGHNVHIITSGKDVNPVLEEKYINKRIEVHKINFEHLQFRGAWRIDKVIPVSLFIYSYLIHRKINELIRDSNLDIVESPNRGFEGLVYSYRRDIPLVVRLHGGILVDKILNISHYPMRDAIIGKFEKTLISNADCVTSPSQSIAQIANKEYKVSKQVDIIPNPINLTQFHPAPNSEAELPTILYVGRFQELKGVFILARAIPKVLVQFPKVQFIFIGPDTVLNEKGIGCREYLRNKINDKRVNFYEEMSSEELVKFYHKSWICVFPSFYESFGMVALEAMACGKAVIATKVGGFAEIIEDRVSGLFVPPSDVEALTEAILELLRRNEYRKQLGENAYKRAKKDFSLEKIANTTLKMYEDTINKFNHKC